MAEIKAADVAKLRKMTGAGMMDCKVALKEANGDFDVAVDVLRKKGQKVANKRADRDATEGAVITKTNAANNYGVLVVLNCETDFVAKNDDFVKFANEIADAALANKPADLDALKKLPYGKITIEEEVTNQTGVIGEKIALSHFEAIEAPYIAAYIHPGNKLASLCGFSKGVLDPQMGRDVVMQIAAMNPLGVDKDDISQEVVDKEIEVGKEAAMQEGKPADLAEKIAKGKLNKFFAENTLLNQQFVKDNKQTIKQYINGVDKDIKVTGFKRYTLDV